jgi:hypothetical protein
MRRPTLLLSSLVATLVLFACDDDTTKATTSTTPDSGTSDAAKPDTPDADAAGPDSSTPQPVTVHVTRGENAAADVLVVFHDEGGAVLTTAKTDATGTVKSSGAIPAQVSVLLGEGRERAIHTWTGVEARDELFAKDPFARNDDSFGTYASKLPGAYSGANRYAVGIGPYDCGGSWPESSLALPLSFSPSADCLKTQNTLLAVALTNGIGPKAFAFKKGLAIPASGSKVNTTFTEWSAPASATLELTNREPGVEVGATIVDIVNGVWFDIGQQSAAEDAFTFPVPAGFADAHQFAVAVHSENGTVSVGKRVPGTNSSASLDVGTALPALESATMDTANVKRPKISRTSKASLASTDGGHGFVELWGQNEEVYRWSFVVPPGATTVQVPQFPAEAAAWLPFGEDGGDLPTHMTNPRMTFVESDVFAGYAAFRSEAGRLFDTSEWAGGWNRLVLPKDGTLRITSYEQPVLSR